MLQKAGTLWSPLCVLNSGNIDADYPNGRLSQLFLFKIFMLALPSYLHLTNANTKLDAIS